jgi:hypothetical protein
MSSKRIRFVTFLQLGFIFDTASEVAEHSAVWAALKRVGLRTLSGD